MEKKNIAIIFGGHSAEYEVSLQSAYAVLTHLDTNKFKIIPIGITKDGDWFYYAGDYEHIKKNTWSEQVQDIYPVVVLQNCSDRSILVFKQAIPEKWAIDVAFPILHGKNGEDGTIQGLFHLANIPIVGCHTLSSALCMDKDKAHKLVQTAGIAVPESVTFQRLNQEQALYDIEQNLHYPLFVKPLRAGSSFGITKIQTVQELAPAIQLAFEYDNQVIVEEEIDGFEVGCAILGNDELTVGRVDEIELSAGFFDYVEKYTLKSS